MYQPPYLSVSRRLRSTPFTKRVTENGVKAYTVYNHTLLPAVFESVEADYHHLKSHVQIWDVSCEKQVEINGPDARQLIQMLTPRSLDKMQSDQCYYIPMVDEKGGMINDPVAVKISDNRYWVSLADSDMLYWIKGLAIGKNLNVSVFEPDVSPLAVQGPKSDDLMAKVTGEDIRALGFFRHKKLKIAGQEFIICRSGWSKQGGFEIYVDGSIHGEAVWDELMKAGQPLNVRAGCPNGIERIESGLLSYGNDMTAENSPFECGLGRFCHKSAMEICIGGAPLLAEKVAGPKRIIKGLRIDGDTVPPCTDIWPLKAENGGSAGTISSAAWSPDLNCNIAIAMVDKEYWDDGAQLIAHVPGGERSAQVCPIPFNWVSESPSRVRGHQFDHIRPV